MDCKKRLGWLVWVSLFAVLYRCIPTLADNLLANNSVITNAAGNNVTKAAIETGLEWVLCLIVNLMELQKYFVLNIKRASCSISLTIPCYCGLEFEKSFPNNDKLIGIFGTQKSCSFWMPMSPQIHPKRSKFHQLVSLCTSQLMSSKMSSLLKIVYWWWKMYTIMTSTKICL